MRAHGRPRVPVLFIFAFGNSLAFGPFTLYLALYAKSLGFTPFQWTVLNTVNVVLCSAGLLGLAGLLRQVSIRAVMQVTYALLAGCFVSIALGGRPRVIAGGLFFGLLGTVNTLCIQI